MIFRKKIVPLVLCASVIFTTGCSFGGLMAQKSNKQKFNTVYFDYFDTVSTIIGYCETQEAFDETCAFIESELARYDDLYDAYDSLTGLNNMNYVNQHASEAPVKVDPDLFALFEMGKEIYAMTDGMTNFAMGSVYSIWHDYREAAGLDPDHASVPELSKLQEAALHCNIDDVILDSQNQTVYYADSKLQCDVGAFAKGYAIERIAQSLIEQGISGFSLNIGGNIRAIGAKPDASLWTFAIENPGIDSGESYVHLIETKDSALTTSGSYQRFYTVDGVKYHHIIHPDTLFPVNHFLSVSILNEDTGIGDALSTAVFNMTLEDGKALIESLDDTEAMWVLADGSKVYTDGFTKSIKE
ncbi:MAG: FAD:protein FMN transferase [bacterium]|nr:FAD:protein FMN transferase [bacterium]